MRIFFPVSTACAQNLGDVVRSAYLSLPHPCSQFSTTKSLQKTLHQLLEESAMRARTGPQMRELSRVEIKDHLQNCHFISTCSAPVQLRGYEASCSPPSCSREHLINPIFFFKIQTSILAISRNENCSCFFICAGTLKVGNIKNKRVPVSAVVSRQD